MTDREMDTLTLAWREIQPVGVSEAVRDRWWDIICQHYKEAHRHYHTLSHIEHMAQLCLTYASHLNSFQAVLMATFFHDVIYDPKAADNEEQSALLFKEYASEINLQDGIREVVEDLILQTKVHQTPVHTSPGIYGEGDVHYLLDFDMAVLGWPAPEYKKYAAQIEQEYIHVPKKQFCARRAQVLQDFLKTANIYATKQFRDLYEKQAQANITGEISELMLAITLI